MNGWIVFESLSLDGASLDDALADGSAAFACGCFVQVFEWHRCYLHLDIDAVQERAGDLTQILLYLSRIAHAGVGGMIVIAAGAGVHTGYEHKAARDINAILGA